MIQIQAVEGDITVCGCEAIVNAANSSLLGGGGVDGAIHRAAGPELLAECRAVVARQGGCRTGDAVITGAGELDALYVIHTVGPVWNAERADELDGLLAQCYQRSLALADQHGVESVAFPNISTGVYGYPKERAASIAIRAVHEAVAALDKSTPLKRVLFVCFDPENTALYNDLLG